MADQIVSLPTLCNTDTKKAEELASIISKLEKVDSFSFFITTRAKSRFSRALNQYFHQVGLSASFDSYMDKLYLEKDTNSKLTGQVAVVPSLMQGGSAVAFLSGNGTVMILSMQKEVWISEFINLHPKDSVIDKDHPYFFCKGNIAISRIMSQGFTPTLEVRTDWDSSQYQWNTPYKVTIGKKVDIEVDE